jgi:copper chaperone CopZ
MRAAHPPEEAAMKAVHITVEGLHDEYEASLVEMLVRFVDGVKDVASIHSLHMVSVLYDESVATLAQILNTVRAAGFRARVYRPAGATTVGRFAVA